MKKTSLTLIVLLLSLCATAAFADGDTASATNTARAELIAPLTLVAEFEMSFGRMIKNFSTGSETVTLTPEVGNGSAVSSDNTRLMLMGGHNDGDFLLSGEVGETVQLSAGGSFVLSKDGVASPNAQQQMTVNNVTFLIDSNIVNDGGTFVIPVGGISQAPDTGGTLTVNGDTETGAYSGSFTVTASYQ